MPSDGWERDRALDLRRQIRNGSIALAAAGTAVLAGLAAATIPGKTTSSSQLQGPRQLPSAAQGGGIVTGGSTVQGSSGTTTSGGLQAPNQLPSLGQGGGVSAVTGGS